MRARAGVMVMAGTSEEYVTTGDIRSYGDGQIIATAEWKITRQRYHVRRQRGVRKITVKRYRPRTKKAVRREWRARRQSRYMMMVR